MCKIGDNMILYDVPIEPLEERYSSQWSRLFSDKYISKGEEWKWLRVEGSILSTIIRQGSFLDVIGTNFYKASQLKTICMELEYSSREEELVFLFHDLWFPGIEMLAYIRDGLKRNIKIYGCLHAGTYDQNDFLSKMGMRSWGCHFEKQLLSIVDGVFVATHYHKRLIEYGLSETGISNPKIHVTGFPLDKKPMLSLKKGHVVEKENIVVFPHRLNEEKQPDMFKKLEEYFISHYPQYSDWRFIRSKDICKTKKQYYDLLKRSKFAVSFALQETWGIAMQEALFCRCIPLVPQRLSYQEMYSKEFFANTIREMACKLHQFQLEKNQAKIEAALHIIKHQLYFNSENAIDRMLSIIKSETTKQKKVNHHQ